MGETVTAKKVGNLRVIAVEQIIGRAKGSVANPNYARLVLDDGTKIYGCKTCEFTSPNTGSMFYHAKQHASIQESPAEPEEAITEPTQAPVVRAVMDMTVGELLAYVAFLEADGERPEALRERAEAAEARVKALEAQLGTIKAALS
jgi:hypothetical protein